MLHTRTWATARKTRTLTPARASGCRACCSRLTETTSWKRRSNLPSTAGFQLVECALNDFPPDNLLRLNHVLPPTNVAEFWISSYLSPVLHTRSGRLSWFYCTKMINSSQFIELLKVKTTSL